MSILVTKNILFTQPLANVRTIYGRCRIGNRDWVGFGHNGSANYKDDAHFPFPAVRFKENTRDIWVSLINKIISEDVASQKLGC